MNTEKMGLFISELRKSRQMTQKELAAKLNISDKAVSKWERGLSCPDIALLSPLSDILGVTATELLNGARTGSETVNVETVVASALEYGKKNEKRNIALTRSVMAAAFSVLLLIGVFVVLVVDVAVAHSFSWSPIPVSAIVFAWLTFFPAIKYGVKGITGSLIAVSVFVAPFLYVLDAVIDRLTETDTLLFPMAIRIAPLAVAVIWIAYFLFRKFKTRILLAAAILALLTSPVSYLTNAMIANMLGQPYDGVTVVLNTLTPAVVAAILFAVEFVMRKTARHPS